ncbi:MAG: transposase [Mangrovibacterium sp.]
MFPLKTRRPLPNAYQTKWVVHCEPSLANAEHVVRYLGQYTHRVAITNQRILNIADGKVTFLAKDYRDRAVKKPVTLDGVEFSFDASGIFAAVDHPAIGFSFGTLISQNAGFAGRGGVSLKPESRRSFFPGVGIPDFVGSHYFTPRTSVGIALPAVNKTGNRKESGIFYYRSFGRDVGGDSLLFAFLQLFTGVIALINQYIHLFSLE